MKNYYHKPRTEGYLTFHLASVRIKSFEIHCTDQDESSCLEPLASEDELKEI